MMTQRLTDFSQITMLYHSRMEKDFPPDELRPLDSLRFSWDRNAYECFGLFDGENILGYAFFVRRNKDYLLDYLAIDANHRDEGMGSLFLRQLAEYVKEADCVVCEVENPDTAKTEIIRKERERRLQFYLRGGYRKTGITSVVFGVDYSILELSPEREHTDQELRSIYSGLYRSFLPEPVFHSRIQVR